jgi:ABC-2 type transport system permease protein
LLRVAVLTALYGVRQEVDGISLQSAITFTGLTQAIIAFLSLFGWYELMENISSGDIASDMLKPLSLFRYWLGRDLGRALGQLLLRGLPMMLMYTLLFDITLPVGMLNWLSFAASLGLAWLVSFAWRFLVNLAGFWTPNALGIGRMVFTISWFLSGFMMPLRFFPEWFQQLCYLTPFPHAVNSVVEIYLGLLEPHQVVQVLLGQALWALALWLAAVVVMQFGIRKLVIQGG